MVRQVSAMSKPVIARQQVQLRSPATDNQSILIIAESCARLALLLCITLWALSAQPPPCPGACQIPERAPEQPHQQNDSRSQAYARGHRSAVAKIREGVPTKLIHCQVMEDGYRFKHCDFYVNFGRKKKLGDTDASCFKVIYRANLQDNLRCNVPCAATRFSNLW